MVKDIVCGMHIDESKASAKSNCHGKEYSFCSLVCKEKFDTKPEKYIERKDRNK